MMMSPFVYLYTPSPIYQALSNGRLMITVQSIALPSADAELAELFGLYADSLYGYKAIHHAIFQHLLAPLDKNKVKPSRRRWGNT
jgi:hypothetical protein